MGRAQQGRLWVEVLLVLVVLALGVAFFGFLFSGPRSRPRPRDVRQQAQLNAINAATELFKSQFRGYPPSDANDPTGQPYCGAMKLTEALMGQDLLGFHSESIFRRDGLGRAGISLYPPALDDMPMPARSSNLQARNGPLMPPANADAWRLVDVYGKGNAGPFPENTFVLCDCYYRDRPSGQRTGMPILYYRADPTRTTHDLDNPDNPENIYRYRDNEALLLLGVPGKPGQTHPLVDPKRFYWNTQNRAIPSPSRPYRADTFILISAGPDGLYGTADDICNFEWKYREH